MQQYRDFPFKVQMSGKPRGELFLFPFPPTTTYSESFFVSKLPLSWDLMRKKFRIDMYSSLVKIHAQIEIFLGICQN